MITLQLDNAKDRLKALHRLNILDTLPEQEYDEITRMAAYTCRAPIAFISFIDDKRQWFKSKVGFTENEVPAEFAFCSYAIGDPENIFIVQDATRDERFKNEPHIITRQLLFCISVPLLDEGIAIGTLCVIDHKPRKVHKNELEALRFLAKCITDKLQDRKNKIAESELHNRLESEIDLLYKAINSSSDHFFIIDPESMQYIDVNETALKELGYGRKEFLNTQPHDIKPLFTKELLQKKYFEIIHSPRRAGVMQTLHKKKNGELIDVEIHFNSIKYNNRDIIISSARDITDKINYQKQLISNEKKYRDLFNALPGMIFQADNAGKLKLVSPACFDILGYLPEELVNKPAMLLYIDPSDREKMLGEVMRKGAITNYRIAMRCKNGDTRIVNTNVNAIIRNGKMEGIEGIAIDITERAMAEEQIVRTKDFYETVLNSISEDIAVFDQENRYLFLNRNAVKNDQVRNWLIGKNDFEYCIERGKDISIAEERWERHKRVNETGQTEEWMENMPDEQGNTKYIVRHLQPFVGKDGIKYKVGFGLDVTALKKIENQLWERKKYLRSLINSIPDIIFRMDKDGRYLDYKADNKNLLAIEPEKLLNKTMYDIFSKEVADFHLQYVHEALRTGNVVTYEYQMRVMSGENKFFESRINKKEDDEVVVIIRDITERKESELKLQFYNKQLKEREENIEQLIASAPDAIVVCDPESTILLWNPKSEELFGWKEEEIIGKNLTETIIPPQHREAHLRGIKYYFTGGKGKMMNNTVEITALNKKGEEFYVSITISVSAQGGEPVFIAFLRDISQVKKNEIAIKKSEKQLNDAQQVAKVGSFEMNIKTNIMHCSREYLDIHEIEAKDNVISVEECFKLVHPDDMERVMKRREELNKKKPLPPIDYRIITPAGKLKYITCRTEIDLHKEKDIIFGTIQDITERVMFDKKLYKAVIESEEKERKRIAGELHDGVLQYLAAAKLTVETAKSMVPKENTAIINLLENGKNLLLNSLDITRKVSHDLMPSDLYEMGFCAAVQELVRNLNEVDKIHYIANIKCEIKEPEPVVSVNLFRIIQEFIRNSQKYSGAQNITIEISYADNYLELLIADDGKGYEMTDKKKTGIGILNMVKRIETIGGTYTYDTAPGKGVKLTIKVAV